MKLIEKWRSQDLPHPPPHHHPSWCLEFSLHWTWKFKWTCCDSIVKLTVQFKELWFTWIQFTGYTSTHGTEDQGDPARACHRSYCFATEKGHCSYWVSWKGFLKKSQGQPLCPESLVPASRTKEAFHTLRLHTWLILSLSPYTRSGLNDPARISQNLSATLC